MPPAASQGGNKKRDHQYKGGSPPIMPPAASQGKDSSAVDESVNENKKAEAASDVRAEGAKGSSSDVVNAPLGPTTCASPQFPHVGTGEVVLGKI